MNYWPFFSLSHLKVPLFCRNFGTNALSGAKLDRLFNLLQVTKTVFSKLGSPKMYCSPMFSFILLFHSNSVFEQDGILSTVFISSSYFLQDFAFKCTHELASFTSNTGNVFLSVGNGISTY